MLDFFYFNLPFYGSIQFGSILYEAGFFGSAALGLIVLSTSTMAARLRAMRGLAKHLLWLMATVAVFGDFDQNLIDVENLSLSGVNLNFIGFKLNFGWFFVQGIGGLIVLRYAHYRIFAKLGPPVDTSPSKLC